MPGSGIGRACALRLGVPGCLILALDRDGEAAAQTARAVDDAGGGHGAAADVLINNTGIFDDKPLEQVTADDLRRMYEVNMIGLFITTQAALAQMPDGGRIINISSRAYLGSRDHAHYVPSKAAVIGLTRTRAIEHGPRQIMVNAIAPGMVRTPMLAGRTAGRISQFAAGYLEAGLPEAEDIAQAIAFFGDPQTMFITGQVLIIDGGRSVRLSGT